MAATLVAGLHATPSCCEIESRASRSWCAYGRGVTAGTSTVRVQSALHSYVDVTLPVAGSASWSRAVGWLEVGISPEQPIVAQIMISHVGASGSLSVEAAEVYNCASAPSV